MTREEVIAVLVKAGARADRAAFYAEAFAEYREACANIAEHGVIVKHPRTGNPTTNPYAAIRDKALARMNALQVTPAGVQKVWAAMESVNNGKSKSG